MAVLKMTSPEASPSAPSAWPRNTRPSRRTRSASFLAMWQLKRDPPSNDRLPRAAGHRPAAEGRVATLRLKVRRLDRPPGGRVEKGDGGGGARGPHASRP